MSALVPLVVLLAVVVVLTSSQHCRSVDFLLLELLPGGTVDYRVHGEIPENVKA